MTNLRLSDQEMFIVDGALAAEEMGVDGERDVEWKRDSEVSVADIGDE